MDLFRGIATCIGWSLIDVPGATGYIDTNYLGKGQYAGAALDEYDFVWVHVEAPDEAGHEQSIDKKIEAIQECDEKVLGTILSAVKQRAYDTRILLMPDHPTPIATGSHSSDPVPFILFDSTKPESNNLPMDEREVHDTKLVVEDATRLMGMLLED